MRQHPAKSRHSKIAETEEFDVGLVYEGRRPIGAAFVRTYPMKWLKKC